MKKDIHPTYYDNAIISCACGTTFKVGSTQAEITTELCSKCHPFFTGKQKLVDTAGRVEKFEARQKAAKDQQSKASKRAAARDAYQSKQEEEKEAKIIKDAKVAGKAKKEAKKAAKSGVKAKKTKKKEK